MINSTIGEETAAQLIANSLVLIQASKTASPNDLPKR